MTIIGRGHSGTRAMSATLTASGVFMGEPLNPSEDLVPPDDFYRAVRGMSRHVRYLGNQKWDFSQLLASPIDPPFVRLVESYLSSVLKSDAPLRGWKLPETTLALPWIVRMFPDIKYIHWVRDPRDCILGWHITDDLSAFGIPCEKTMDVRLRRAISWQYHTELVKATPKPRHWLTVRMEDFVLQQDRTLEAIGEFLGFPLAKVEVKPEAVGRWRQDAGIHDYDFFQEELIALGYTPSRAANGRGQNLTGLAKSLGQPILSGSPSTLHYGGVNMGKNGPKP